MKISILLPTYNGSKFILEQLESIYNQTVKPDEVIIIDDCSFDNTVKIIDNYINIKGLNDCWRVVVNTFNKGWRKNFHDGIELTKGELVFFCDQDDVWFEEKIETMVRLFDNYPDKNVISSDKVFFCEEMPQIRKRDICVKNISIGPKAKNLLIQTGGSTMAFRREYYNKIKKYYSYEMAHDDFFWKMSISDNTLLLINNPLIYRRIHGDNASLKKRNKKTAIITLQKQIDTSKEVLKYVKENEMSINELKNKKKCLENYIRGNGFRIDMINNSNFFLIFKIVPYCGDIYYNFRMFAGDIILTLFPRWREEKE